MIFPCVGEEVGALPVFLKETYSFVIFQGVGGLAC